MSRPMIIITAKEAAAHAATARATRMEETIARIPSLERDDPLLYDGLQVIFEKVEAGYLRGAMSVDFNLDKLFGAGRWSRLQQELANILCNLGYKAEFSFSSNPCNERLFVSFENPKD